MPGSIAVALCFGLFATGFPVDQASGQLRDASKFVMSASQQQSAGMDLTPFSQGHPHWKRGDELWADGKQSEALKAFAKALKGMKRGTDEWAALALRVGTLLKDADRCADALPWLDKADMESFLGRNWARYEKGQCLRTLKRGDEAALVFQRVEPWHSNMALVTRCLCFALLESGKRDEFLLCAAQHREKFGSDPKLLGDEARIMKESGHAAKAADLLRMIASKHPTSSAARGVLKELKELAPKAGPSAELTKSEWVSRALGFYDRHKFKSALGAAEIVLDTATPASREWCDAAAVKGAALARAREQTKSLPHFETWLEKCPTMLSDIYLYRASEAARAAGRPDMVNRFVDAMLKHFPTSRYCDDVLLFLARAEERAGNSKAREKALNLVLEQYPTADMASEAAFQLLFPAFLDKQYQKVIDLAQKYIPLLPQREDYRTDGRLAYWLARSLTKKGKKAAAREVYGEILRDYPLSWYGLLAYLRLEETKKGLGEKEVARVTAASMPLLPSMSQVLASAPSHLPNLQAGALLLKAGLTSEARSEFTQAFAILGSGDVSVRLLEAALYHVSGHISISHQIMRRAIPEHAYTWPKKEDDRWWLVAYPQGYPEKLKAEAKRQGVPWSFVMAVMREESGFNPEIVSYANAFGLLQILPKTASDVAKKKITGEQLKNPDINIPIGVEYFAWLLKRFEHPALAAAGYNSGPGGVQKSFGRYDGHQLDEFVESIPFDQTRRYTKRVVSSAWRYHVLYGDSDWSKIGLKIKRPKK